MPAPFVVAHLQMGLLLQNLAVPLDDAKNERAGIFLTNSLTGWDFAGENPKLANWPELEAERAGAGKVKQEKPILVILGNPPYNAFAGISPEEEQGLVEPYKEGLSQGTGASRNSTSTIFTSVSSAWPSGALRKRPARASSVSSPIFPTWAIRRSW